MNTQLQQKARKTTPSKRSLYTEFILWTAMPQKERENLGIEWQQDFAEYYKVDESTLWRWKQRADFEERVDAILKMWSTDKTPAVVHAIYRSAIKGNPFSQQLWLQYFKKFNPKAIPEENKQKVLSPGDIRYMVEQLPEQLKEKHYGYLRELAEDIAAVRNARGIADDDWNERPATTVPDEADRDASDVPNEERSDDMAKGDTRCAWTDLVRHVSQNNNQSAERWW